MRDEPRLLLRVEEAARILGLGRSKMYELLATGELPAVRIGRARRILVSGLEAWVERQVVEQGDDEYTRNQH